MKLAELFSAENIVADRRSTYQRQTISKGFILRQRDVFMPQLAARSGAPSDARVELEAVPDGGVEILIRAAGEAGVSHDRGMVDGDLGVGGIARLLEDEFEHAIAAFCRRTGSPTPLEAWRLWDGSPLPRGLCRRVLRVDAQHPLLSPQMAELEAERRALRHISQDAALEQVRQVMPLRGSGINGAWL
jgi:hypothetical protein